MANRRSIRASNLGRNLAPFAENLTGRYHRAEYLGSDPLVIVRGLRGREDREFAGLFAALLAYGNVKQINASLGRLFSRMEGGPASFIRNFEMQTARRAIGDFKHRFTDSADILCLCWLLHQATRGRSVEQAFCAGYNEEEPDLVNAASRFVDLLYGQKFTPHFRRAEMLDKTSFKHLLPRADRGSACKRIHLWLRWMIRPDDGIDLGLWKSIPSAKLLVPVDTHILRIGQNLGIIRRKTSSLATAREITGVFRIIRPNDPVRYDFALCRLGILQKCPTASNLSACGECELNTVCEKRKSLERRIRK